MKYEVWVSISASVDVNANNEEEAEKKASAKIERVFDKNNVCLVGNVDCHNVQPAKDLTGKRADVERAWMALTCEKWSG